MMTFRQAKDELAALTGAYGATDVGKEINRALRALVKLYPLRTFREIVRFTSAGPGFVLPQGSAGLVRACVNGSPVTMRGQDFRFMLSGPGDMERPPFRRVDNIITVGRKPVMLEPKHPFRVFFTYEAEADDPQPSVKVRGFSPYGELVSCTCSPYRKTETAEYSASDTVFSEITEIVLGTKADGSFGNRYLTLYAQDDLREFQFAIGLYNPGELVPTFMHYEIQGLPPDRPVEILAEVRMGHVNMVEDSDVLPVDTTEPIEYMIRSNWEMRSGETQRAETYRQKAEEWLRREEATSDTVQTKITINSEFWGSAGEVSAEAFNI